MPSLGNQLVIGSLIALLPVMASALDFRSVSAPKVVLYDAPSTSGKKVVLLSQYYPVEVVISTGDWLKVRDAQGGLNWLEAKQLSSKRTVLVTVNNAEIRLSPEASGQLLATVQKDVVLNVADAKVSGGWVKVQHRDGVTGYMLISSVWGAD